MEHASILVLNHAGASQDIFLAESSRIKPDFLV
jgi:hypothetical protein